MDSMKNDKLFTAIVAGLLVVVAVLIILITLTMCNTKESEPETTPQTVSVDTVSETDNEESEWVLDEKGNVIIDEPENKAEADAKEKLEDSGNSGAGKDSASKGGQKATTPKKTTPKTTTKKPSKATNTDK